MSLAVTFVQFNFEAGQARTEVSSAHIDLNDIGNIRY